MAVWNGGGSYPVAARLGPIAARRDGVVGLATGGYTAGLQVAGHAVGLVGFDTRVGDVVPPITEGRRPSSSGEVALGAKTMRELGVELGDTIEARSETGNSERLAVVGEAVLPTLADRVQLGAGGYATIYTVLRLEGKPPEDAARGVLFLALDPRTDREALFASLKAEVCTGAELSCELFQLPVDDPTDIVNFGRVRSTPLVLGFVLALLAVATFGQRPRQCGAPA
jgi:hypothetical protein